MRSRQPRRLRRVRGGVLPSALLFAVLTACAGCLQFTAPRRSDSSTVRVDPQQVYANYRFDSAPSVLSFGVQPLWVPTCVIWEVMARDQQLQEELKQARCRIDVFPFFKGQEINDFVRAGKLQGGVVGDLPALKAASEFNVRVVSLIQQGPCAIIARRARPLEELRGSSIGYAPGSNAHYTLLKVLREHGVHPEDVRLIPMEVIEMADALADGRIDAFSAWEPTPTLTLLDHPTFEVLARTDARGYLYFARPFFLRQPGVVRALVASEIRALRWLRLNDRNLYIASGWARERAVAFGGAELPLTVYDFHRLARRDILRVPTAPRLVPALLEPPPTAFIPGEVPQQFRVSRELGMIDPDADWRRVRWSFAAEIVPQILSDPARHRLDDLRLGPSLPMQGVTTVLSPVGSVPTPTTGDPLDSP